MGIRQYITQNDNIIFELIFIIIFFKKKIFIHIHDQRTVPQPSVGYYRELF